MRDSIISSRTCEITQAVEAGQLAMFRLAERDHGLTLKILAADSGIPFGTLRSYAQGTSMPVTALVKLARVIPNELTSLMLDPGGKAMADADAEETDFDDAALASLEFLTRYVKARHPEGPGNIRIVHSEEPDLRIAARGVIDRVGKVA